MTTETPAVVDEFLAKVGDRVAGDGELFAAICQVMAGVPKLEKNEENKFARYKFASIDGFLQAMRPLMAEAGLMVIQDQVRFEIVKLVDGKMNEIAWLSMDFSFQVCHTSGACLRPILRTAMVQASMGSQAFGAAQSYALKQFLRTMFMVATGEPDADADSHPQTNLPAKARFGKRDDYIDTSAEVDLLTAAAEVLGVKAVKQLLDEHGAPNTQKVTEQNRAAFAAGLQGVRDALEAHGNKEKA